MPVYVDPLFNYGWKLGPSCHLTADTLDELHDFAARIGMKRVWFQISANEIPHYDLVKKRRDIAVKLGAIELSRNQMGERIIKHNEQRKNINSK